MCSSVSRQPTLAPTCDILLMHLGILNISLHNSRNHNSAAQTTRMLSLHRLFPQDGVGGMETQRMAGPRGSESQGTQLPSCLLGPEDSPPPPPPGACSPGNPVPLQSCSWASDLGGNGKGPRGDAARPASTPSPRPSKRRSDAFVNKCCFLPGSPQATEHGATRLICALFPRAVERA